LANTITRNKAQKVKNKISDKRRVQLLMHRPNSGTSMGRQVGCKASFNPTYVKEWGDRIQKLKG
jgi:hypothetical protein